MTDIFTSRHFAASRPLFEFFKLSYNLKYFCFSIKYAGFLTYLLGMWILLRDAWALVGNRKLSTRLLTVYLTVQSAVVFLSTAAVYLGVFYLHLALLTKAGPHDSVMTSAFQASLEVR